MYEPDCDALIFRLFQPHGSVNGTAVPSAPVFKSLLRIQPGRNAVAPDLPTLWFPHTGLTRIIAGGRDVFHGSFSRLGTKTPGFNLHAQPVPYYFARHPPIRDSSRQTFGGMRAERTRAKPPGPLSRSAAGFDHLDVLVADGGGGQLARKACFNPSPADKGSFALVQVHKFLHGHGKGLRRVRAASFRYLAGESSPP
jgi:hypothetical protein